MTCNQSPGLVWITGHDSNIAQPPERPYRSSFMLFEHHSRVVQGEGVDVWLFVSPNELTSAETLQVTSWSQAKLN